MATFSLLTVPIDILTQICVYTNRQTFDTLNCTCNSLNGINSNLNFAKLLSAHLLHSRAPEGTDISKKEYKDRTRRELNLLNRIFSLKTIWKTTNRRHQMGDIVISNRKIFHDANESRAVKVVKLIDTKWVNFLKDYKPWVCCLAAADGYLAVVELQGAITIWDVDKETRTETLQPRINHVYSAAIAKNKLFYASSDTVEVYDLIEKKYEASINVRKIGLGTNSISPVIAASENSLFVVAKGTCGPKIKIIDLINRECVGELETKFEVIRAMHIDDGKLYSRSFEKEIKVWDIKTRKCLVTFQHDVREGNALCASDGEIFYSGSDGVFSMDFNAEHCVIFDEIADLFDNDTWGFLEHALERFARMPIAQRKIIYAKHYQLLKNSAQTQPEDWKWAEDTFHNQNGLSSTPAQKAQTIRLFTEKE